MEAGYNSMNDLTVTQASQVQSNFVKFSFANCYKGLCVYLETTVEVCLILSFMRRGIENYLRTQKQKELWLVMMEDTTVRDGRN
jgi:hypothetical protein